MRKTKLIISCLAALTLFSIVSPCVANANAQESIVISEISTAAVKPEDTVQPKSDIIKYRYKEYPDGSLYKRLYNYTKDMWVGDWIKIRDAIY